MKVKQHVGKPDKMENTLQLAVKCVDSTIFKCFKNLTSATEKSRLNAGVELLQHLSKNHEKEKREIEHQYTLKRLIRGVGASTTTSRAGFFTTLVGFLQNFCSQDVDVERVLDITKTELHVGGTVANKEDADAIVGQILVCGALLRSQKLVETSAENLGRVTEMLIASSKHRTYHNSMAYLFLCEILLNIDEEKFKSLWPKIELELRKPWENQTINTINCLTVITNRFPNVITKDYLKVYFGGHQLLNRKSFKQLLKVFWDNTSTGVVAHPAFENFAKYIAHCKHLESFWSNEVNECLSSPTKLREIQTLKILTDILENADHEKVEASKLLTQNFIKMMVSSLKGMKLKKDETLKAFYDDFFEALTKFSAKVADDTEKVAIINKLILRPGTLSIEKYSTHRVIHQIIAHLGEIGIQQLFETYKKIFLNKLPKNPENVEETWLNTERQNAGYMLHTLICHKNVQTSFDWRTEQLTFMMTLAFFYTNEEGEIIKQKEDFGILTDDFIVQLKNLFYTSLQSKVAQLEDEKKILLSLVETCNEVLQRKHHNKYLRNRADEKILKAWNEMYAEVHKKRKKDTSDDNLHLVFCVLLLHMGLQLFREPEMAETAILDLEKCIEKTKDKNRRINGRREGDTEQEPEWIDVVVDLFLHLLSQNNGALRSVVNSVFPYLCNNITLTAMHQILSVLDMKDGNNPLSDSNEDQEDDEEDNLSNQSENSEESCDENAEDEDDDDDEEEIIEEEEEEGTFTDKLRNAVSTALGNIGKNSDQESIDLDDMDEEEGRKLDEALAEAFKLIKRPEENKKSKDYRVRTTTVMHFRIRVLDLIEIYIQHNPSLLMCLEIMLSLYDMIEFCGENELKPLSLKVEKVLSKLASLKNFSNTDDVSEKNICDLLRTVVEKKVKASVFELFNKLRSKCTVFLISCEKILRSAQSNNEISTKILSILGEYLNDFIKLRNPTVNITLLSDIFTMGWQGVWQLATILSQNGLSQNTRVFRRIQIVEILDLLYKNQQLIRNDINAAGKHFKTIENSFQKHLASLAQQKNPISVREFTAILNVLYTAHKCHIKIQLENYFDKEVVCESIQSIRKKIKLENALSYNRFCTVFGLNIIKNSEVVKPSVVVLENGTYEILSGDEVEEKKLGLSKKGITVTNEKKTQKEKDIPDQEGKRKNKITKDSRKQKKLRKEERLKKSSEGLNGGLSFVGAFIDVEMSNDHGKASSQMSD